MLAKSGYVSGFRRLATIVLGLLLAAELCFAPAPSYAQERSNRFNIFRQIFRPLDRRPDRADELLGPAKPRRRSTERRKRPSQRTAAKTREPAATAVAEPPVDKLENARIVVVVGDFLATGLAESLTAVFAQSPGVQIVDRTNGSSGFVRDDFYNWPEEIKPLLETENPAAIIVMIGSNDRQQIKADGKSQPVRSEAWSREYESRIEAFTTAVSEKKAPLIWVGMPAFKSSTMSSDMLAFNDIYRQAAEKAGGTFVDIWDGFVDENGGFTTTGPDINGQPVQLRGSDGINMTRAGKRKIAFYVEKPLNRILGNAASPGISALDEKATPEEASAAGELADIERTLPISLTDPELDGGTELLGATARPKRNGALTPAERLAVEGIAPDGKAGRADDFTWRRSSGGSE